MQKFIMRKKYITAPAFLLLVCSLAASGKTDSSDAVSVAPSAAPQQPGELVEIANWCQQRGGYYYANEAVCRIQESMQLPANTHLGSFNTGLQIYENDTVSVIGAGVHSALVGNSSYPATSTFESRSQGVLVLRGEGYHRGFRIRSIQVTRCFDQNGYSVRCP